MDRRTFLAAAAVLTGKSPKTTLAADGGKPVRPTPLRASFSGPACYDDKELFELKDVLQKRAAVPLVWIGQTAPNEGAHV